MYCLSILKMVLISFKQRLIITYAYSYYLLFYHKSDNHESLPFQFSFSFFFDYVTIAYSSQMCPSSLKAHQTTPGSEGSQRDAAQPTQ